MKKRRIIICLMICALLVTALSACKRENAAEESAVAAATKSGKGAEAGETAETAVNADGTALPVAAGAGTQTVTDIPAENDPGAPPTYQTAPADPSPTEEPNTPGKPDEPELQIREGAGRREACASIRLPDGIPFKRICENGAVVKGMEQYYPGSYSENWAVKNGTIPVDAEEYVYSFNASLLKDINWCTEIDTVREYYNEYADILYSDYVEKLGKDGLIVIGEAKGTREGHLAYFDRLNIERAFTLTDFSVKEVLRGSLNTKTIRINENYCVGNYVRNGNQLISGTQEKFALPNGQLYLLLLKKTEGQDCYYILGNGGFPLTDDYKKYDQEYLDHLAGYLNLIPDEWNNYKRDLISKYDNSYFASNNYVDPRGRSFAEALEANKDDLLVALAQKYRIRIWPYQSRAYEDAGFAWNYFYSKSCVPDYKTKN